MTLFGDMIVPVGMLFQHLPHTSADLTTWSSFRQWQSRRRGGEGLWISQIQTPKPSSNAVSKGCCAPFPSLGRLNRGPSLGFKQSGLYLFDFWAPLPLNTFSWQNTAHSAWLDASWLLYKETPCTLVFYILFFKFCYLLWVGYLFILFYLVLRPLELIYTVCNQLSYCSRPRMSSFNHTLNLIDVSWWNQFLIGHWDLSFQNKRIMC